MFELADMCTLCSHIIYIFDKLNQKSSDHVPKIRKLLDRHEEIMEEVTVGRSFLLVLFLSPPLQ